jgi:uncharacterized protein (DUF1786 family)
VIGEFMEVYIYHHLDKTSREKLDLIISLLKGVLRKEEIMSKALDDLIAQVKANEDVEASALVLIQGIAARIDEAGADPAKLAELSASLKTSADTLSEAVVANTPAV